MYLPQVLFCVAIEGGVLRPAEGEEGVADEVLDVGGDGALGAVVLVVAFAGEEADEVVLDGALQMAGHVVVHLAEAEGHADGLVWAILGAVGLLHLRVPQVDIRDDRVVLGYIVLDDAAKTVLAEGTYLALANDAFCRHFTEFLLCHLDGGRAGV